jgi:hypothetical protein
MKTQNWTLLTKIYVLRILIISGGILASNGCSTTPIANERETIAFDCNEPNAGIIGFLPNGSLEITRNKRNQFVSLVKKYGSEIQPIVPENYDLKEVSSETFELTMQDAETFKKLMLAEERINP